MNTKHMSAKQMQRNKMPVEIVIDLFGKHLRVVLLADEARVASFAHKSFGV
jgi:hypothetical protein